VLDVWCHDDPVRMLVSQPAQRQPAAAQAETITALRHPDEDIYHDARRELNPEQAERLS
jgi:hypothetical protein